MSGPVPALDRIAAKAGSAAHELSISVKLIGALAIVLAPLLIFAGLAAQQNYGAFELARSQAASSRLVAIDRAIDASLAADFAMLETVLLTGTEETADDCSDLRSAAAFDRRIVAAYRFNAKGTSQCSSGTLPAAVVASKAALARQQGPGFVRSIVIDDGAAPALWLIVRDNDSGNSASASLPISALRPLLTERMRGSGNHFTLSSHGKPLLDWKASDGCAPADCAVTPRMLAGAGLTLELRQPRLQLSILQQLGIAAPLLMWLTALVVAWWVAERLMVEPVLRVRSAFVGFTSGETSRRLGEERFLSREMSDLATAFDQMADDIGRGQHELREALAEQKRLTREVHHRVKNNLQIVSSLLSIQAREAPSDDVALAYATVQARVGALALVHRWMYDDETANGVDLRALSTDLCASLEQALTTIHKVAVTMRCDVERVMVGQDTAVPVAFLITELTGAAARLAPPGPVSVKVGAEVKDGKVTLSVTSEGFMGKDGLKGGSDPAARIVTGMARQLRAPLHHDADIGRYRIDIALPPAG